MTLRVSIEWESAAFGHVVLPFPSIKLAKPVNDSPLIRRLTLPSHTRSPAKPLKKRNYLPTCATRGLSANNDLQMHGPHLLFFGTWHTFRSQLPRSHRLRCTFKAVKNHDTFSRLLQSNRLSDPHINLL